MKRIFAKTRDLAERKLRGLCAGLSPKKRVMTVVGNFYMIFRAIYDIGREDARQEVIEIELLEIPDFVPADTLPDRRIREMEEFFNQFNRQGNE